MTANIAPNLFSLGDRVELRIIRDGELMFVQSWPSELCLLLLRKSGELRNRRRFHDERSLRLGALGLLYHSAQGSLGVASRRSTRCGRRGAADMATRVPTRRGDVLILLTEQSFTVYAVGPVSVDGQQDFHKGANVKHVTDRTTALAEATALVVPGRRIFLLNIDSGVWSEIATEKRP